MHYRLQLVVYELWCLSVHHGIIIEYAKRAIFMAVHNTWSLKNSVICLYEGRFTFAPWMLSPHFYTSGFDWIVTLQLVQNTAFRTDNYTSTCTFWAVSLPDRYKKNYFLLNKLALFFYMYHIHMYICTCILL